ncbi:unnamed protein product [Adineta steineri]|uniref:Uncharacterized protein n=1 Tax=Adineta steineri TaxID=433720 RepID=A0A815C318_9BILA|nr:unnamed protein product [Adineta steineri]
MASHIRIMLTKLFGTPQYRLLIVGLDASGKTSLLYKLKLGENVQVISTIGFNVETITYKNTELTMWDVGGCDKIRPLIRHYFQGTQALICIIDSNDRERIGEISDELWRMLSEDEIRDIPILFYLNKIDLVNGLNSVDIIEKLRLNSLRNRQWHLQPCSVLTNVGLYEGLDWLVSILTSKPISQLQQTNVKFDTSTSTRKTNPDEDQSLEWLSQIDEDSNEEFIEKFEKNQLPVVKFDHRSLLRIIWSYFQVHNRKQTIKSLFDNINKYIKEVNETLIYFWIQIVHYASEATKNPTNDFSGFLLMNPQLLNQTEFPLSYYKKDTLFSDEAKKSVVLPDIKQLPNILPSSSSVNKNIVTTTTNVEQVQPVDELDDDEFLQQFELCTLTNWSHKTHIRMAWLYLTRDGRRLGVKKIFDGIKNFIDNSKVSRKTTFHFTMTYFWIQMIDLAIAQSPKNITFDEFLRLNPQLMNGGLFLEYYKKETMLNNPIARQEMVLPDIKPLPTLIISNNKK